jgi:methionine--tRNA ligase beta chain
MKAQIDYNTFVDAANKLDIRFGVITEAERIPKNKKMVKLVANFGEFNRTLVSNIGGVFEDLSTLVGKHFLFILNLEPRELNGILSEAMILSTAMHTEVGHELLPFVELNKNA